MQQVWFSLRAEWHLCQFKNKLPYFFFFEVKWWGVAVCLPRCTKFRRKVITQLAKYLKGAPSLDVLHINVLVFHGLFCALLVFVFFFFLWFLKLVVCFIYIYTWFYEYLNSLLLETRSWLLVSLCRNLAGRLLLPHTEGTMAVCDGGNAAFSSKRLCLGCAVSQARQFASFSPLEVALVYYCWHAQPYWKRDWLSCATSEMEV